MWSIEPVQEILDQHSTIVTPIVTHPVGSSVLLECASVELCISADGINGATLQGGCPTASPDMQRKFEIVSAKMGWVSMRKGCN